MGENLIKKISSKLFVKSELFSNFSVRAVKNEFLSHNFSNTTGILFYRIMGLIHSEELVKVDLTAPLLTLFFKHIVDM